MFVINMGSCDIEIGVEFKGSNHALQGGGTTIQVPKFPILVDFKYITMKLK